MQEFLTGFCSVLLYYVVAASAALVGRRLFHINDEVFRKALHFILLGSLLVWVYAFSVWWHAAVSAVAFAVIIFPVLKLAERIKGYSEFVTERKSGELKMSLLVVFGMFTVVICICWGWLGDKLLVLACVYAWGFGDAAAALIGKRFGRHKLTGAHIEGCKSAEGSLAMFGVSFLSVAVILLVRGGLVWYGYPVTALLAAGVAALVELYTMNGMDTITCPLAAMAVIVPLVHLFGGNL